jgi:putative hemolysin
MLSFRQVDNQFHIEIDHPNPLLSSMYRSLQPGLERALSLPELSAVAQASEALGGGDSAENRILRALDAACAVDEEALARIPHEGPLIVVANHPFGGIEGLMLASILKRVRPDVRIMANLMLGQIRQLRDLFILVDPFASKDSARANSAPIKETLRWLGRGGALGVFPAGTVSHLDLRTRRVADPAWSASIGRIAQKSGATVLPVYFEGRNGPLFQALGLLHPLLRTARLPREFVNKKGLRSRAHIGPPITPERIAGFKNAADVTAYLRIRSELQRPGEHRPVSAGTHFPLRPVIPQPDMRAVEAEILALPQEHLLLTHGDFAVYAAPARHMPLVLREIGRLREITFRAANEGTGRSIDVDRFDDHYLHLFLWDTKAKEIAAAYRLGQLDRILESQGKDGLYTRTLFNIRKRLLRQLSPALEMGRSFVRREYQKQFLPLMLLWKGIGAYVVRNPQYKHLFGPVSINSAYSSHAQDLLMHFLRRTAMDERASMVRAKTPPPRRRRSVDPQTMSTVVRELGDLSSLIADIEEDHKDIPILLKQYLKLGGLLLGFNVDPDFSDVLDGLILVDLTKTDPRMLERYMGKDGAATFLAFHAENSTDLTTRDAFAKVNTP